MAWTVNVVLILLLSVVPVQAGKRADCRRACGGRIAACQGLIADFSTLAKGCAKAVLKQCVKAGIGSCDVTSTTTSTSTTTTTTTTPSTCPGDLAACTGSLTTCRADLATCQEAPRGQPLSTGQTQCWDGSGTSVPCAGTGQDGELQKGLGPAYVDNGDGTITDRNTGLMWEKLSADWSIHHNSTEYTWENAFTKIAALNSGGGFAGHTDWRLPNVNELKSLVAFGAAYPAVSSEFNSGCAPDCTVLTCSCTGSSWHWSSSTYPSSPERAGAVVFSDGFVTHGPKTYLNFVRAVRGGSRLGPVTLVPLPPCRWSSGGAQCR